MKQKGSLTHQETAQSLADCLRDIMAVEVTHRTMGALISRGKAVAALITANQREEILESRRTKILEVENKKIDQLTGAMKVRLGSKMNS
jgi:hypothetical protein